MTLHPQTERFLDQLRFLTAVEGPRPSVAEMRAQLSLEYPVPRRELPRVADLTVDGPGGPVPVRLYRPEPPAAGPLPLLVYLHGGGWVLGGVESVDVACRDLAAAAGCTVLSVDYRLAPEHPFPAAVEDAWAVTADVARDPGRYGARPGALAVAGDSAGGNLAAVVALLARDAGVALAHQLLVYPITDTARDTESWARYGDGYGLDADAMARFTGMYVGDADPADPLIAPLRAADLSGLAPATVITAEYDILRDEGEAYARRLHDAGVPVEQRRYPGVVHSFFLLPEIFDTGAEARRYAVRRLRAALHGAAAEEGTAA
ncbi:alpha/beta hydrolase [Actinomadura macrotermitis]|uniref:Carboxylesterase NlhH n=1 Tax=Actinomadura macrotermitis TaxID=2585200 RepID=A0A7K0C6L7_9ACTN|nr:alpha/beta hydrolase [Actinomadura macrotermitis]MQY09109.1 Carboxylesterase NlhH [Actinomadura macrotermitis]